MKKSLLRAALVACLPFCAMALAVVTTPAVAAEKGPVISKSIIKYMTEAKKANDAKDWKTVIEQCKLALQATDRTDYDNYMINRFLAVAYFNSGDHASARGSFEAVVKNPATPLEDRKYLEVPAMELAAEANDYAKVIELGKIALQDDPNNADVLAELSIAYYDVNDFTNAQTFAQKAIDQAAASGKMAQYGTYQVLAFSYDKQKKTADEVRAFELMARDYGKPDDWKYLLDFSLELLPGSNKNMKEIAALDLFRLRMITAAPWSGQNYAEMADAAQAQRSWGDAHEALQKGLASGALQQAKVGALMAQVNADAKKDEPALPAVEKLAKTGKEMTNVAEGYYGYGRYADAARAAQKAIELGGPSVAEAQLVLGMSQVRLGDEANAAKTLAAVSGDPAIMRAAQLWSVYVSRKYDRAPAAPATH